MCLYKKIPYLFFVILILLSCKTADKTRSKITDMYYANLKGERIEAVEPYEEFLLCFTMSNPKIGDTVNVYLSNDLGEEQSFKTFVKKGGTAYVKGLQLIYESGEKQRYSAIYAPYYGNCPVIKDSATFIAALQYSFRKKLDEIHCSKGMERITAFEKVKLYGSDSDYYFIEYAYPECGGLVNYPYQHQFLVSADAEPVAVFSAKRCEFIKIFPNELPFLITVQATAKGNGWHEVYKINAEDSIECVLNTFGDYDIRTVDAHQDNEVFNPYELQLVVKDYNNDGINDIAFVGERVLIMETTEDGTPINGNYSVESPYKRIPVEYIFLYNPDTGHFIAKKEH